MPRNKTTFIEFLNTRKYIASAATDVFQSYGYTKSTMIDVSKYIGKSQSYIYIYFKSKDNVGEYVCRDFLRRIEVHCWTVAFTEKDACSILARYVCEYYEQILNYLLISRLGREIVSSGIDNKWMCIQGHVGRIVEAVESIIKRGISDGLFVVCDYLCVARAVYDALALYINPVFVWCKIHKKDMMCVAENEKRLDNLLSLLVNGLQG